MSNLARVLAHREWLRRDRPFPHIVGRNVFRPSFYAALSGQLQKLFALGLSETPDRSRLSRSIPGYDAYGIGLGIGHPGPVSLFTSPEWRDMMCRLFGIRPTPYVFAGAHHHAIGSRDGFVHNDLNPVWFPKAKAPEIRVPDPDVCAYKTGEGLLGPDEKIQVVRGAVVIFFLLNDGWRPGDGGDTVVRA